MPSMGGGGAERVLINLLNQIDYNKFDVELILLMKKGKLWDSIPKEVNKSNLGLSSLYLKVLSYVYRIFNLNLFWMLNHKIKGQYDVGISFMDSIFTELLFLKSLKFKKKITVVHSSYKSHSNRSKFIKGKYKDVMVDRYKKLDNIVCVSKESREEFIDLFGEDHNIEVIYNPLNKKDIINKSNEYFPKELESHKFNFIAVGSLIPVKDFELIIRASHILKSKSLVFHLHILGDGFLKEVLSTLINQLKLESSVTLHGFKSNPYPWLNHADVFIMSSKTEGLPTVLCESLILGKPVLVPNIPGCREVIDFGKYGIMCERNENDFSEAMEKCISEPMLLEGLKIKAIERSAIFDDNIALTKYNILFSS